MIPPLLKSLALSVPAVRDYVQGVNELRADRDRLARELAALRPAPAPAAPPAATAQAAPPPASPATPPAAPPGSPDWADAKRRKQELTAQYLASAALATMCPRIEPVDKHLERPFEDWIRHLVQAEPYWFQRIEVLPGFHSPGWSDPQRDKLPYYGLPEDLSGKRVLDIGCAEGFFSFEAERRGAREVIGIDSFPDSVRRFNVTKAARQSNASAFLMNVYDLDPKRLGTFDVVLFYGVFYHLKHPQYALERIRSVCTGEMLFQTHIYEEPAVRGTPWARFHPHGMLSGSRKELFDPTVFWLFNSACCLAILDHVGFTDARVVSDDPAPFVVHCRSPQQAPGVPPNEAEAPWC